MRLLACVKRVPAPGARINLTPDALAIDTAQLGFTMSPHEECAVEEVIRIAEASGGDASVLTVGPPEAEEQLRYAVSLGVATAAQVMTDGPDWDPQRTAAAITGAVRLLEDDGGPFDLILFGNESADAGGFQVGIRVAVALGRPMVNGIKGLSVHGETVTARREVGNGVEVYELPLPAVVGVKEGINLPRYPTLMGRLASKKVQVQQLASAAEPGGPELAGLRRPVEEIGETVILGEGAAAAPAVADLLVELGLL
jgi:electron transfer flavoprotein beta subunit